MNNFKNEKLLVIAPHSDDEVLGCGGLISKVKNDGGQVFVLIFNLGFEKDDTKESQEIRKNEVKETMKFLNVDDYHIVNQTPDENRDLDAKPLHSLIEVIESTSNVSLEKISPTIVAIPTIFSSHQDHTFAYKVSISALRPHKQNTRHMPKLIISYEEPEYYFWSAYSEFGNFLPNFYVNLSKNDIENKSNTLNIYSSQLREGQRGADNIISLAKIRGNEIGTDYAESYHIHRMIDV